MVMAVLPLAADDVQSWTEVELRVFESDRVTWTAGGVTRIRDSLGSLYDRRAQTGLDLKLTDSLSTTLGYILRNHDRSGYGFGWDHRMFAGLSYPLLRRGFAVDGTTLYERHIGRPDVPDFNRYRQQIEIERPRARVSPLIYQSVAFKRQGFVRTRSRTGVRWRFAAGHSVTAAYQYESIKASVAWHPRHAILSEWNFDLSPRDAVAR